MFVFSESLLMIGSPGLVIRSVITAVIGIVFFANAIGGWFLHRANYLVRVLMLGAAFSLIDSGLVTDFIGGGLIAVSWILQKFVFKEKS